MICFSNELILAIKNTSLSQIIDAMPDPTRQDSEDEYKVGEIAVLLLFEWSLTLSAMCKCVELVSKPQTYTCHILPQFGLLVWRFWKMKQ